MGGVRMTRRQKVTVASCVVSALSAVMFAVVAFLDELIREVTAK